MDEIELSKAKSTHSRLRVLTTFHNVTPYKVDVYWINYQSNLMPYQRLQPGQTVSINTFVSHPWVFVDAETGEYQQANGKYILWPTPLYLRNTQDEPYIYRTRTRVHMPLRTLKTCALRTVFRCLANEDFVERLTDEIPASLINGLRNMYRLLNENNGRRQNYQE